MLLRALAVVSGIVLVAAAAYASLTHADAGLTSPYSVITLAVAGGLVAGALCFGAACAAGRHTAALAIAIGMLSGELYSLILTGERVVAIREVAQVSLREATERREDAARRVGEAEATLASAYSSRRLERALAAKTAADLAVIDKSAERGCASNCRTLLQAQVDAAQREVGAAQAERDTAVERATKAVEAARVEIGRYPHGARSEPAGCPPWALCFGSRSCRGRARISGDQRAGRRPVGLWRPWRWQSTHTARDHDSLYN
jgi:hypothetical protein